MKAEVIAIGSELTCGARLDTNSQWLSRELEARGWTVQRHTTVADDREAMIRIYQEAARRSRVVLITGGLGPTLDDITRETLAEAFDQPLVEDAAALKHIQAMFESRGREMPDRNKVQALRPELAETVHNAHGTAPGILMELHDPESLIAVMPGVPAEMKRMFLEQLVNRLPLSEVFVQRTTIRTFGYGESDAERLLEGLTARGRNPEVGITASQAVITLSITSRAGSWDECCLLTEAVREQILSRLGEAVFGEGEQELYEVVADQLLLQSKSIALLEGAATGGLIGQWLTETNAYATTLRDCRLYPTREAMLAVAESSSADWETVLRMEANRILKAGLADYVILSSPTELVEDQGVRKQQGSVVVLSQNLDESQDVTMTGNLAIFRNRAARCALNLLRLHLNRS